MSAEARLLTRPALQNAPPPAERSPWLGALLIIAGTLVAYGPAYRAGFIWDDDAYLTLNELVQRWDSLGRIWFTTETPQYYPLVFSSFWIEHKLWGLHPTGYHVVNVLLHVANALLVWRLARRIGVPAPWWVGAVFALHPVHVESVAWVTERKNVLSGLFYLLALRAYLLYDRGGGWRQYAWCVVVFLAALKSKSVTATLPVVIALVLFYQQRWTRRALWALLPLLTVGAASGLHTAYLERTKVGAAGAEWSQPLVDRALIIAPRAFLTYLGKIAWPDPLIFVYPRWEYFPHVWRSYVWAAAVGALLLAALLLRRRIGWGPLLLLAFAGVTLFPALGFLNVYPHRYSYVADHFQYLGSLGFIILYISAAVYLLRGAPRQWANSLAARAAVALVLAVLGGLTWRQCHEYRDLVTLWERTLRKNPNAWIALVNLAEQYMYKGRYAEAEGLLQRAVVFPVARPEAYGNWGGLLALQDRHEEAIAKFDQVLALRPTEAKAWMNKGIALLKLKRYEESAAALIRAGELAPNQPLVWSNLAALHSEAGQLEAAAAAIARGIALDPQSAEFNGLAARLNFNLARYAEAATQFRVALRGQPDLVDLWYGLAGALTFAGAGREALAVAQKGLERFGGDPRLLLCIAWVRAAAPEADLRNGAEALRLANQVVQMVGPDPRALDVVAAAAAESGDFPQAVAAARAALQTAGEQNDARLADQIRQRLELYEQRQPFRIARPAGG